MSPVLVRDVMTPHVRRMNASEPIRAAAEAMQLAGVVRVEDLGVERLVSGGA